MQNYSYQMFPGSGGFTSYLQASNWLCIRSAPFTPLNYKKKKKKNTDDE